MEAIGRLAGGIAHDFNNLLTAILGYADFLLADVPGVVAAEMSKASRRRAAAPRPSRASCSPSAASRSCSPRSSTSTRVVASTDKLLRRLIGEDIELVMNLQPGLAPVKADPGQIEQVAAEPRRQRARRDAGGRPAHDLDVERWRSPPARARRHAGRRPARTWCSRVSDTGRGMTDEVRAHIFEPFFTTKDVGKGTGLGLATVYGIVQQSGGHIEVDSAPGEGTPVPHRAAGDRRTSSVLDPPAPAVSPGGGARIGNRAARRGQRVGARAGARSARRAGYRVLEAANGEEGLRLATDQRGRIDLVITDVVMPVMGGRELARACLAVRGRI